MESKILLATHRNEHYRDDLEKQGFSLVECPLVKGEPVMKSRPRCDCALIEINDKLEKAINLIDMVGRRSKIFCQTKTVSSQIRKFLLDRGITDIFLHDKASHIAACVKEICIKEKMSIGSIIILDDNDSSKCIISEIFTRFNYSPIFSSSAEDLIGRLSAGNAQFILINLGTRNLNIRNLVNMSYASADLRNVPVLAYKDMEKGILVHELSSGLNRITKFIFSSEELYSFLVEMLFKKSVLSQVARLNRAVEFEKHVGSAEETLRQVYFLMENDICGSGNFLNEEVLNILGKELSGLKSSLLKLEGLKWMRIDMNRKNINTVEREESACDSDQALLFSFQK